LQVHSTQVCRSEGKRERPKATDTETETRERLNNTYRKRKRNELQGVRSCFQPLFQVNSSFVNVRVARVSWCCCCCCFCVVVVCECVSVKWSVWMCGCQVVASPVLPCNKKKKTHPFLQTPLHFVTSVVQSTCANQPHSQTNNRPSSQL
jgi:hypothetical protein